MPVRQLRLAGGSPELLAQQHRQVLALAGRHAAAHAVRLQAGRGAQAAAAAADALPFGHQGHQAARLGPSHHRDGALALPNVHWVHARLGCRLHGR